MEIATARVDPERPSGEARGFPGRESERIVEKLRNGGKGDGLGRRKGYKERGVCRRMRKRVERLILIVVIKR